MAIHFLNTVDFNKNQLNFARIQNLGTDPSAANSSIGQIYFNTTADTLKQYVADAGSGAAGWVEVGSTSVKAGTGIGVTFVAGEATVRNTGLVTVLDGTYINLSKQGGGDNTQLTADLSAINGTSDSTTRFLSKDNTWDIVDGATVGKATASVLGTVELFSNTVQTVAANAVTTTASRTYGVQFNSNDQMVVNVPWTDTNVVTYDLKTAPTGTAIRLIGSNSTNDDVTISGTAGRTAMTRISATELRVNLTDNVSIVGDLETGDDLEVGGVITQVQTGELNTFGSEVQVPTATSGGNAPNLAQVELLIAGVGVFQGGYSAATNPGTPNISGGSNVALDQGDYFVVTADGDITFSDKTVTVEIGDFIFANAAITASSTPASTQYTIVIADANLATAGTLTSAKRGVAGFDATTFDVTVGAGNNPGFVTLKPLANPYGAKVSLTAGDNTTAGQTTFTVDVTALFTGADARNCKVEVTLDASGLTVYPEVTRNGTGDILLEFMPQVSNSIYSALITIV